MKRRLINERFNEAYALTHLLQLSPEFKEYYNSNRSKIISPLIFEKDYNLGELAGRVFQDKSSIVIQLRRIPVPFSDAHLVAHEMQHIVHREHSQIPIAVWTNPQVKDLAGSIASSVHDLLVERDLLQFGFDVFDAFVTELSEEKRTLANLAEEPDRATDLGTFINWSINYASKMADHDFINREYEFNDYSYLEWFESRYPNVANEGKKIYDVLQQVDLQSNDSIYNYQDWIITQYNLREWISIIT